MGVGGAREGRGGKVETTVLQQQQKKKGLVGVDQWIEYRL